MDFIRTSFRNYILKNSDRRRLMALKFFWNSSKEFRWRKHIWQNSDWRSWQIDNLSASFILLYFGILSLKQTAVRIPLTKAVNLFYYCKVPSMINMWNEILKLSIKKTSIEQKCFLAKINFSCQKTLTFLTKQVFKTIKMVIGMKNWTIPWPHGT